MATRLFPTSPAQQPSAVADPRASRPRCATHAGNRRDGLPPLTTARKTDVLLLASLVTLAMLLGGPWWPKLFRLWQIDPNYSHGPFVLLLSMGLVWHALPPAAITFGPLAAGDFRSGMVRLLLGLMLNACGWFTGIVLFGVVGLVCMLRGILTLVGGARLRRATDFSTLFLLFMAPLPAPLEQWLSVTLQGWAAALSTQLLQFSGVAVFREGALLHLPNYTLEVGVACSGLRQLTAFVALGCLAAHFGPGTRIGKLLLVVFGLVVAVVANSVRVLATAWILLWAGPQWIEGLWHNLEGTITIALGAALVMLAAWSVVHLEELLAHAATTNRKTQMARQAILSE